jgi:tRNA A-37 threonylcarbamoyl transferase component Bud32
LCKSGKEQIGILTMNYYKLGSIGSYEWNEKNIHILKNVLFHTIYSYINAYLKLGFVHRDLHADNVLLKDKKVYEIDYSYKKILVDTFEVRIMDFSKSKLNKDLEFILVLQDIQKLLDSIKNNERYSVKFEYKSGMLRKIKNKAITEKMSGLTFDNKYFDELNLIIDSLYVEYAK